MKTPTGKPASGQAVKWTIAGVVLAGTLLIFGIADLSEGSGAMAKIFFFFLGAVIVVQVIPGLMLFGAMLKALCGFFSKRVKVTVRNDSK